MKKKCEQCGKEFWEKISPQKFCSLECRKESYRKTLYGNWKKELRICKICEKNFYPKSFSQKICSKKCKKLSTSFNWKINNMEKLKDSWFKLRFEIFKRDNFTCQYCGRNVKEDKIKIHCDHIIPKKKGGKDIPENLITACEECNLGKEDILITKRLLEKIAD